MLKNPLFPRTIMAVLAAVTVVLGIMIFIAPPSLFPDPANGFNVMRCMEMGGRFNFLTSPDQDDISKNIAKFLTWWSPGQYLVPYLFKLLLGINTGQACALTITLCQLSGLYGFYFFFKRIGFTSVVAAISMVFIACQQFFAVPYVFYNGGEILLFAFTGWFLYGCTAITSAGWKLGVFVLLAGWTGFLCKSSVMWAYAAGLLFLWLRLLFTEKRSANWLKSGLWIAMPGVISISTIWLFFLSKGENPTSAAGGLKLTWATFSFPLASPLLAGFSIDDLSHGLIFHTGKPLFAEYQAIVILLLLAAISIWLILTLLRKVPNNVYQLLLTVFYTVAFVFFSIAYLRQMNISYEARHFRIIGLIIVPGLIYLADKFKPTYRAAFALVWAGIAFTSVCYLVAGYNFNKSKSAHGVSGLAQQNIDQPALNTIIALDKEQQNATFVFVSNDTGLEVRYNRIINLNPISDDLKIDFDDYLHEGHSGPLYIILPDNYAGPKEKMILKSFPGYKGWYGSMLSNKYVMYAAK